jgi:signal-transduction protein with cAMP-binding, CBS, and nucleotidyltransferase domain
MMKILDADETIKELGWSCLNELSTFGALSSDVIADLLQNGVIRHYQKGEYVVRVDQTADDFQIILRGRVAYYRCFDGCDVLTRYFDQGEQMGFDQMIGLLKQNGTDVAQEDSLIVDISGEQFFKLRADFPADFGLLMINLAREMAREIEILENVIGKGTGWRKEE